MRSHLRRLAGAARVSGAGASWKGWREPEPRASQRSRQDPPGADTQRSCRRIRRPPPPQRPGSSRRTGIPGRTANTSTANTISPVRPSFPSSRPAAGGWPGRKSVGGRSQLEGTEGARPAERISKYYPPAPRDITQKDPRGGFFKRGCISLNLAARLFHARDTFIPLWGVEARIYAGARASQRSCRRRLAGPQECRRPEPAGRNGGSRGQPKQPRKPVCQIGCFLVVCFRIMRTRARQPAARRICCPSPPQRPGSSRRTGIPGRTANTSTASTISPVRPALPRPSSRHAAQPPPEAGRAARVPEAGASWKGWREPGPASAADRIRRRPTPAAPPDPPPSTASTPWILPDGTGNPGRTSPANDGKRSRRRPSSQQTPRSRQDPPGPTRSAAAAGSAALHRLNAENRARLLPKERKSLYLPCRKVFLTHTNRPGKALLPGRFFAYFSLSRQNHANFETGKS